ncbi:MAG TPA: SUMF1/EgtB/PvdO family nonheme iron enzyme [Anaerolineae bacterium]|nr:SUMF1/EgtB/PvdO family nonheme iron enzyme [Anaerolineae bacterium]
MVFQAQAGLELNIDGSAYLVAEHPAAPGMPYGQEGRAAVVYQVVCGGERRALKVFKPRHQVPTLVYLAEQLRSFAGLPGLAVCARTVLTPQAHIALLRRYPELTYAVLMPWIEGPTWMQVLLEKRTLPAQTCLEVANHLAGILAGLEQRGLAHCDLSGPNVLLPGLAAGTGVALVDVEQMYGPELHRPPLVPGGSPGYAHRAAPQGLWGAEADRFAGAVLLAEVLGWCDERIRQAAWGESYFDPAEVQDAGERWQLLLAVLRERWGQGIAHLVQAAWSSATPEQCPNFGQWLAALPERVPERPPDKRGAARPTTIQVEGTPSDAVQALIAVGRRFEAQGKREIAKEVYRQALEMAPAGGRQARELGELLFEPEPRVVKDVRLARAPATEYESSESMPQVPQAGATKLLGNTGITLVYVPAGTYWMGSADTDRAAEDDEKPRHEVELGEYWIGQTPVTNAQFRRFIEAGGYGTRSFWSEDGWDWVTSDESAQRLFPGDPAWNKDDCPVLGVNWYEAEAYCRWAGGRLPTEAEWEVASRGGPLSRGYAYAGSNNADEVAWYSDNSGNRPRTVKTRGGNELGLYDMSGNVREWVADWYGESYYSSSPMQNPTGPASGGSRVVRGGSWDDEEALVRCAYRDWDAQEDRPVDNGFRVAQ